MAIGQPPEKPKEEKKTAAASREVATEVVDDESLRVLDWRMEQLTRAGAPTIVAACLASSKVDLYDAVKLVKGLLEKQLDPGLAIEILT
jgi:hypothetical protein